MKDPPAIHVPAEAVHYDLLSENNEKGYRKIIVRDLYPDTEIEIAKTTWRPGTKQSKCPVILLDGAELSYFNQDAHQDRHKHLDATEVYILIDGEMEIEAGKRRFRLAKGDLLIVKPNVCHQVLNHPHQEYLCLAVALNGGGAQDKIKCNNLLESLH